MARSSRGGGTRKNTSPCSEKKKKKKRADNAESDGCSSSKPSSSDHSMEEEEEEEQQLQKKKNYNAINSLDKTLSDSEFSTPKAKRSRIPDPLSCPPAPKKRRLTGPRRIENSPSSSVSFFTSPDLDFFFQYALHEISLN